MLVRAIRPDPATSVSAMAISRVTMTCPAKCRDVVRAPTAAFELSLSLATSHTAGTDIRTAEATTQPPAAAGICKPWPTAAARGNSTGDHRASASIIHHASPAPMIPPPVASSRLSVKTAPSRSRRRAPTASRVKNSARRSMARTSSRFETLAQQISSTRSATAFATMRSGCASLVSSCSSGTRWIRMPRCASGYSAASCRATAAASL